MPAHVKRGVGATDAAKAKRIAALRASSTNGQSREAIAKFNPDRPLTEKQRLFAKFWAEGESPRSAAARAGFSTNSTIEWKMRQDPAILKAFHIEKSKFESAAQMTRQKFMDGLIDAAEMARLQADPQAAVAAWRQIGLACGYFEPTKVKIDIDLKGNIMVDRLKSLSDAELLRLIEAPALEGSSQRIDNDDESGDDLLAA